MCSYLMLEIKSFVSLQNESFLFWMRVRYKGGVKICKILIGGGGVLIKGGGDGGSDRFRIFWEGLSKKG